MRIKTLLVISLCLLAIVALGVLYRQKNVLDTYRNEMQVLIEEARLVSHDLEEMMNNAVDLSRSVVNDMQHKTHQEPEEVSPPVDSIPILPACRVTDPVLDFYEHLCGPAKVCPVPAPVCRPSAVTIVPDDNVPGEQASYKEDPDYRSMHPYLAVRLLQEQGLSIREIARKLERGQGEINLMINLDRKKKSV